MCGELAKLGHYFPGRLCYWKWHVLPFANQKGNPKIPASDANVSALQDAQNPKARP
jgi:hypothetical protein